MANPMRDEVMASRNAKLRKMGQQIRTADEYDDRGEGHVGPGADGSQSPTTHSGYADQYQDGSSQRVKAFMYPEKDRIDEAPGARSRLDRPGRYARGGAVKKGATTVNVIVASGGQKPQPAPMMPPPMPMPAGPPPAPPGGMAPAAGVPTLPRKRGGRTSGPFPYPKMEAGAGSGEGRLEKIAAYGKNAKNPKNIKGKKK